MSNGIITNETNGKVLYARPVAPLLMDMLEAGGLIKYGPKLDEGTF